MNNEDLVRYGKPPVTETILGVQFDPIVGLTTAHLGAFWKSLGEEWPNVEDAPFLDSQFEKFGEESTWGSLGLRLELTSKPNVRLQITNEQKDRMIQVQRTRLHFNWLGSAGNPYPQYPAVRSGFLEAWKSFAEFLTNEKLPTPALNQWEVTYVNTIPKGTVWSEVSEWGFFRPISIMTPCDSLSGVESFSGEWHYPLVDSRGRLHVQWQHAQDQGADKREVVVLTLTARGPLERKDPDIVAKLNLGRGAIVKSFSGFMSDSANKFWEQKNASN